MIAVIGLIVFIAAIIACLILLLSACRPSPQAHRLKCSHGPEVLFFIDRKANVSSVYCDYLEHGKCTKKDRSYSPEQEERMKGYCYVLGK